MIASAELVLLSKRGWLSLTSAPFRQAVLSRLSSRKFSSGETIFRVGDTPAGLWALVDGAVQVEIPGPQYASSLAHFATPGFWFGEGPLILKAPRRVTIYATRPSILAGLSLSDCRAILEEDPPSWRWIALLAAMSSDSAIQLAADLLIDDPRQRVVATLLRLAGYRTGTYLKPSPVPVSISQRELGHIANVSRTVISGILLGLEQRQLIAIHYRRLEVVDAKGLVALLTSE